MALFKIYLEYRTMDIANFEHNLFVMFLIGVASLILVILYSIYQERVGKYVAADRRTIREALYRVEDCTGLIRLYLSLAKVEPEIEFTDPHEIEMFSSRIHRTIEQAYLEALSNLTREDSIEEFQEIWIQHTAVLHDLLNELHIHQTVRELEPFTELT